MLYNLIHLGGPGLHSALSLSAAAFVGSYNASRQLVNQLLGYSSDEASSFLHWIWLKFREKL